MNDSSAGPQAGMLCTASPKVCPNQIENAAVRATVTAVVRRGWQVCMFRFYLLGMVSNHLGASPPAAFSTMST